MAISATFVARFDSFFEQVNKAEAHLGDLTSSSESVQKSIDRLAKSFSGDKIIQDATLTAKAIEDIGGASMLTEKEAARVNRTMTEALEKMQKLGVDVPPGIKKLADETANAGNKTTIFGQVTSSVTDLAKKAALAFGAMFAAEQILSFAKHIISIGGELTDLSSKTGVSTTALQQFKYAGGQVGIELDAITSGINMMQKRLAGDDKSATNALKSLGVEVGAFKAMKPEQQFSLMAEKIGSIEDPMMRTKAATDLFGKSGAELLPALTKEFGALTEKANSLGIVMDEQTVSAMDALSDTVDDLGSVAMAALGRIIQPLVPLLSALAEIAMKLASVLGTVLGFAVEKITQALKWLGNAALEMTRSLLTGLQMTADAVPGFNKLTGASDALGWAIGKIDAAQKALNTTQPETIKQAKQAGLEFEVAAKSTDKAADAMKAMVDQLTGRKAAEEVAKLAQAVKAAGGEQKLSAAEAEKLAKQLDQYLIAGVKLPPALERIWLHHQNFNTVGAASIDTLLKLGGASKMAADALNHFLPPLQTAGAISLNQLLTVGADAGRRAIEQIASVGAQAAKGFGSRFGTFMETSLPQSIMGAITGGGNILHAAGSAAGSFLTSAQGLGGVIKSGLSSLFGPALGAAMNSVVPGLGALMGPLLGKMGSLLGGVFGKVSAEVKQARTEIAGFEEKLAGTLTQAQKIEAGGVGWKMTTIAVRDAYLAVGKTAAEAEAIVRALWDDKNPQRSKAAMEEINAVLDQQKTKFAELKGLQDELASLQDQNKVSFADMRTTAEKFGIDLAKLGPAFNSARMAEKAKEIIDGFETMKRGGADMGAVLEGMTDEINDFVQESLKLGTSVPENMRPMIAELIKNGKLLDANGEKITDISKIPFGDSVASKFDLIAKRMEEVAKKIGELVDLLKVGLVDAAGVAAKGIEDKLNGIPKDWNFKINIDGTASGADTTDRGYALGTMGRTGHWFKNFGAGTKTILHGDEAVVRRDQAANFAAEMGSGSAGVVDAVLGLRADFAAMPQHIARAVRDAILVAG